MNGLSVQAVLERVVAMLDDLGISYALMGALSLGFYTKGRATHDVDVLIDGDQDRLSWVQSQAKPRGFEVDELWSRLNPGIRDTNIRLSHAGIAVDMMLPRDAQDRSALGRRLRHSVGDRTIWVLAPEDIVLQKLKAGRPHDFDDAILFFIEQRDRLEHTYLNSWALRLGVREELDYLWSQSERPDPT